MRVLAIWCWSVFLLSPMVQSSAGEPRVEPAKSGLSDVLADIAAREYQVTWQDRTVLADLAGAWHAPNRAHGFRTYFTPSGIRVMPRTEDAPSWEWGLSWVAYGSSGARESVQAATLVPQGQRIVYRRGRFDESYENGTRGLQQRFVLPSLPEGLTDPKETEPVHLDLAISGSLSPVISTDGQNVDFVTATGQRVLRYSELHVTDAGSGRVQARIECFSSAGARGIRLVLDAREAAWPVTVDLLTTSATWTADGDQANALLGASVATAGDVNGDGYADVIIGAHLYDGGTPDEGRAFVYYGSALGLSTSPAWSIHGEQADAELGSSVATAGDVNGDGYSDVIIGAPLHDNGQPNEGRAVVCYGSPTGLGLPAWAADGDQAGAEFGNSVATAGDVNGDGYSDVVVGAVLYGNGQSHEGRASVYYGSAAGLTTSPSWTVESDQVEANLGRVATAGDVNGDGYADVILGAWNYSNGQAGEGRIWVYHGSASGLATSPTWTAEGNQVNASFGSSAATAGDVNGDGYADVIIGAPHYDNSQQDEGRAFVYIGSVTGLATSPAWTAQSGQLGALYGASVATAGDVNGDGYADVIIGASDYDSDQQDEGRAFVYLGSAAGPASSPAWTAESNQAGARLGSSAATAGDVNGDGYADVIAGAPFHDGADTDVGRAFVYQGSPAGLGTAAGWTGESNQASSFFGVSVATAGDVNGDGYADVVVGAPSYDNGQQNEGRAFAYLGSASGLSRTPAWTAEGNEADGDFGFSVATAGDVNGDGYADVVVGTNKGNRAVAYYGSPAGLETQLAWDVGWQSGIYFGWSVATAGDVNGDGYADVIVGNPAYTSPGNFSDGMAVVYHGSAAGLSTTPAWTAAGGQWIGSFGWSVATAGDVNGDGYSDVIVAEHDMFQPGCNPARALVYHGSNAGLAAGPAWITRGGGCGYTAATAGDVNGDGYADIIVGKSDLAFVHHGSATGLSTSPDWMATSPQGSSEFGWSVATAGDVNGDGYADVIVGAYGYDNGETDEGRAFLYHGSAAGLAPGPAWTAESNQLHGALLGYSVASAGDVNGDGYADVVVGAPGYTNGQAKEGHALLFYGNAGAGSSLRPRQRRVAAGPLAHLGASDSVEGFQLDLLGRTPFGRGRVRLEWEVEPLGTLFDGVGTGLSEQAYDTGVSGVPLSELAADLAEATPYHWRVRLRYDSATTPFAQSSRWLTMPWNGWQETMLRTASAVGAGRVPDLLLKRASAPMVTLSWSGSCLSMDTDYAIYEGVLGSFTSHASRFCTTGGALTKTFAPLGGDRYWLVVPLGPAREGSYGMSSSGIERPQGQAPCLPQKIAPCP